MKKMKALIALLLASAMIFSACAPAATGSTAPGTEGETSAPAVAGDKSITIAQSSEVANLNPMINPRTPDQNVQQLIYDPLVSPTEDLSEYVGRLAKEWEISEDGTVYTFHLNENVLWHDGAPFTAKDVAFTFNAIANPAYQGSEKSRITSIVGAEEVEAGTAQTLSGLEVKDDFTVVMTLKTPDASFMSQVYMDILPEHLLGTVSPGEWEKADFNRAPVGTGMFKFVKWESGQFIELDKNTDYFGKQPQIEKIYYRFGDATTLTTALMNGEVDVVEAVAASEVEMLNGNEGTSAVTYPLLSMFYVGLNQQNEFLKDLKVRQALSHGLDKQKIVSTVYGEFANPTDSIFPDNHWSHNPDVTKYAYDPAKAEALLVEAGFAKNATTGIYEKGGKPLHFTYDMVKKGKEEDDMAQLIQQSWKAIGVDVEIRSQDFSTLAYTRLLPKNDQGEFRAPTAADFDMYVLGFGVEADPDEYRTYFDSTNIPPNGMNFISYSNAKVDQLLGDQIKAVEQEDREKIFHEIAQIASDEIPWIPIYNRVEISGVSDKIGNFKVDFRGLTHQIADWEVA